MIIEGLFWLLPKDNNQYYLAFFPEDQYGDVTHDDLWNNHVASLIASHFGVNTELLKGLYRAFPRGRLELGDTMGQWRIGCADEYPEGWDRDKLYQRLRVLPQNTSYETDEHWLSDKEDNIKIKNLLGLTIK